MTFKKENLEVLWTKDYDDFSFYERNREVKSSHSESKISQSLQKYGWLKSHPMIVDGQLRIRDGQHRFLIAKKLEIEIPVLIVENFDDGSMLAINNASKKWTCEDYLHYHAEKGDVNAKKLYALVKKYGVSTRTVFQAAHMSDSRLLDLNVKLNDVSTLELEKKLDKMIEIIDFIKMPKVVRLTIALVTIINHPNYNHKRMMSKLGYQLEKIHRCLTHKSYIEMFQEIYNYKSTDKVVFQ